MRISDWSSDVCSSDLEGLALDAREHQQRREGEQDYRLPKNGRFDHLLAGAHRLLETFATIEQTPFMLLPVRQSGEAVFDDDNRPVDDQTEVERAATHQVTGHAARVHSLPQPPDR